VLAVAAVLVAPPATWAQGAGDEQYQDPFAPETEQPAPEATPAPAPESAAPSAPAPDPAPPAAPAPSAQQLPYTGADAGAVFAAGAALLLGGVMLRLRLRTG
jgi:pyruvate dehydrogenase E2 component (dihydrolipoamide acetyltransferase)